MLLIHGGAGDITRDKVDRPACEEALHQALEAGWCLLDNGGGAMAAVQAAVVSLEDSGCFSAGKGAVADREGTMTLDASIMDGASRAAGAIAAVPWLKNPILGARLVMTHSPHVLLVGEGAEAFLRANGHPFAPPTYFKTAHATVAPEHGTVGAVAVDAQGHTAAATSTGGIANKLPGRVGDSPLIGAGTYADRHAAVSATGQGEAFVRAVFAYRVAAAVAAGASATRALTEALAEVAQLGGRGGGIVVTAEGGFGEAFTTASMFRAVRTREGERTAIFGQERLM